MPDPAPRLPAILGRRLPELLLLAAFLGYLIAWSGAMHSWPDTGTYQRIARDLLDGRQDELRLRTPGYPLLLIATGAVTHPTRQLFVTQLVLYVSAVYFLIRLLRRLALPAPAIVLMTVLLVLPPAVEPTTWALTEALGTFLLISAFVVLVGGTNEIGRGSLSGLAIAALAVTRPTFQLLAVALLPVVWVWSGSRRALAMLVVSSAIIGGLSLSNYQRFGHFGTSSALGFSLSTRTVRALELLPDGRVKDVLIAKRADSLRTSPNSYGYNYIWGLQPSLSAATGLEWIALERYMLRLNLGLIRAAPELYLEEVGRAVVRFWMPSRWDTATARRHASYGMWLQLAVAAWFWLTLAALFGAAATLGLRSVRRLHLQAYGLAIVCILYTMLVSTTIDAGTPRYRVPVDPLIVLSVVLGTYMWSVERSRSFVTRSGVKNGQADPV